MTNDTTYGYAVTAVDKAGNESAKSGSVSATPQAPPNQPPPNQPPTVSLTSPTDGAKYTAPAKIDLAAQAGDPDGTVSSVSFYDGSSLITTDSTAPYTYRWNVTAASPHVLTAKATDSKGATTTSSAVTITVNKKSKAAPQR